MADGADAQTSSAPASAIKAPLPSIEQLTCQESRDEIRRLFRKQDDDSNSAAVVEQPAPPKELMHDVRRCLDVDQQRIADDLSALDQSAMQALMIRLLDDGIRLDRVTEDALATAALIDFAYRDRD